MNFTRHEVSRGVAMSATKSIMPRGTRQAALIAFCLAACLLVWRGSSLLAQGEARSVAASSPQLETLSTLIEPVLGRGNFRVASHYGDDGARSVLILVDTPKDKFSLGPEVRDRIETILAAATGFQPDRDRLQIQPFAFAPGTGVGISQIALLELGALGLVTGLLGFLAFAIPGAAPLQARAPANDDRTPDQTAPAVAHMRAVPLSSPIDDPTEAQKLAQSDPKRTASILKSWLNDGSAS